MTVIVSVGYGHRTPTELIELLTTNNVTTLVDVRFTPTPENEGFQNGVNGSNARRRDRIQARSNIGQPQREP